MARLDAEMLTVWVVMKLSSLFLNWLTDSASTTKSGSSFQEPAVRLLKKLYLWAQLTTISRRICGRFRPARVGPVTGSWCHATESRLVRILNISIKSPRILLVSSVVSPRREHLSSYARLLRFLGSRDALLWTFSSVAMSRLVYGHQACTADSKLGRTYVVYRRFHSAALRPTKPFLSEPNTWFAFDAALKTLSARIHIP